jgi:hypothetical protein
MVQGLGVKIPYSGSFKNDNKSSPLGKWHGHSWEHKEQNDFKKISEITAKDISISVGLTEPKQELVVHVKIRIIDKGTPKMNFEQVFMIQ